jgi:hypothetical protein
MGTETRSFTLLSIGEKKVPFQRAENAFPAKIDLYALVAMTKNHFHTHSI